MNQSTLARVMDSLVMGMLMRENHLAKRKPWLVLWIPKVKEQTNMLPDTMVLCAP